MTSAQATPFKQTYFHGTRAALRPGDMLEAHFPSNFDKRHPTPFIYFSGTLDAAIWGAELALGEAAPRIYLVEPTGEFEDDPNLTDQKFPGNPSQSYRSRQPLRIIAEAVNWTGHPAEQVAAMKAHIAALEQGGITARHD